MGNPMLLQEARRRSHGFPPASGEHTRAVLEEVLGLGSDDIARLIDAGAVTAPERPPPHGETG
jgi:hypothetical protein